MHIALSTRTVGRVLGAVIAVLVAASAAGQTMKYVFGHRNLYGLVPLFNVDGEQNIPTWYQACSLLACSVLLAVIAAAEQQGLRRRPGQWWTLSAVLLFLSIDEVATLHERLQDYLHPRVPVDGYLHYVWVLPYGVLALAVAVASLRLLLALPARTRRDFLAAGTLYVCGSIVLEMLSGKYAASHGEQNGVFAILTHVEETFEMAGIALFLVGLLRHVRDYVGPIRIELTARLQDAPRVQRTAPAATARDGTL